MNLRVSWSHSSDLAVTAESSMAFQTVNGHVGS